MDTVMSFLGVQNRVEAFWLVFGFTAQAMFMARFLIQWVASEKAHASIIPIAFWYFSLLGGVMLLCYSIYRKDPVFMLGQALGITIYTRNLWLIHKEKRR